MAEKIGIINFTAFDIPSPLEFQAYKKLERRLELNNHVKTLTESHPPLPPWRTENAAMDRTPDSRVYKLASELAPLMDEFHHHILDISRQREVVKHVMQYRFQNDLAEQKYYRHVDLLHAWIQELLFERVYKRVGRIHIMNERIAKREWRETQIFLHEHKDKRFDESRVYPELHAKEKDLPFRAEIKEPNQKKPLDMDKERLEGNRQIIVDAKLQLESLRIMIRNILAEEIKQNIRFEYAERRGQADKRSRWHMHDVMRAFDKAWMHAWDSRDTFRQLVRKGIMEQAELYPRLFKKAIGDPYEIEIREPNQKDMFDNLQTEINRERGILKLIKWNEEQNRQANKDYKMEVIAYHRIAEEKVAKHQEHTRSENRLVVEHRDNRRLEANDHQNMARLAEGRGFLLLGGRLVPQPTYQVDTDHSSLVPLPLGLHGDPAAPEQVAPMPLNLLPKKQKEFWATIRTQQADEIRMFIDERNEDWHRKTQGIRQNLAAIEYGEQRNKEIVRSESKNQTAMDVQLDSSLADAKLRLEESPLVRKVEIPTDIKEPRDLPIKPKEKVEFKDLRLVKEREAVEAKAESDPIADFADKSPQKAAKA